VAGLLDRWLDQHPEFVVGTNEAGMLLADEVRAADAAVWARVSLGKHTGGYRTVPPLLAVEIAGSGQSDEELRDQAWWYLRHGVAVVWLILPEHRQVIVVTAQHEERRSAGQRLSPHPLLPDLSPDVDSFFRQLQ
jgi:Uma2 family endonuclease